LPNEERTLAFRSARHAATQRVNAGLTSAILKPVAEKLAWAAVSATAGLTHLCGHSGKSQEDAMAKLAGKIVLISGGTSGIGAATARLFQSEGATVVVTGSSQASVAAAEAELPGVEALVSDAADIAATKALVDQVKARHGRIDVLFVNAGFATFAPIDQIDEAFFDRQFDLNVRGAFFLMQHAIRAIPDGGAIILTSSVAGSNGGLGGGTVYGATKAAVRSFGRSFAKELLPRRIRVNTVSPGPIVTPLLDKGLSPQEKVAFIEGAKTRVPLARTGTPEEVAAAVLYLAADATFTTGAELFVDGGLIDL
jgi:NAD(P)-dependent dehydrogenase (short-subunit alcohol dehydrogenase family)